MAIITVPHAARFRRIDPIDESGSEVAQDSDLWDKIRVNADLTEVLASAYSQAVIGSHFTSNIEPWFLRTTLGTGATVTYGFNNKHQVKLTGGTVDGHAAVIDVRNDVGNSPSDGMFRCHNSAFANFFMEFRFSANLNFTNHDLFLGIADGNSATVEPTNSIRLRKGLSGNTYRFSKTGFGGATIDSVDFAADNNDNGVTYKSVRLAIYNDEPGGRLKAYYDKDAAGEWLQVWNTLIGATNSDIGSLRPVFRSVRVVASAGDVLLDAFGFRPVSVKEL